MIGVVDVTGAPARLVGGLPLPLRSLLQLQSVGVAALGLVGDGAAELFARVRDDDRLRVAVTVGDGALGGPHLLLRGDALLDATALRALRASPGCIGDASGVVALHRPEGIVGDPWERSTLAPIIAGSSRRVRTAADCTAATVGLLEGLRKPQDGMVSRALNRSLSLAVTRVLCGTGLRPNTLSVGILALGALGAYLASLGTPLAIAVGGVLFQSQSVLDGCDGELARLTFRGSKAGEWIDTVGDDLTNYGFFAGLAVGLGRAGLGAWAFPAGVVGVVAGFVASGIEYRWLYAHGTGDLTKYPLGFGDDAGAAPERGVTALLARARPLFKRDFFVFATMIATSFGLRTSLAMLVLFAAGAIATLSAVLRSEWARRGEGAR